MALLAVAAAAVVGGASAAEPGRLTVAPEVGVAGQYGTWTVRYRVGDEGMAPGGGLRVQLPDT